MLHAWLRALWPLCEEPRLAPVTLFCYPAGLYGPRDRALVAEAGFRAACTCEPGLNTRMTSLLELRRIQVDARLVARLPGPAAA
jgi:hypothetical protein